MNNLKGFLVRERRDVVHAMSGEVYLRFRDLEELDIIKDKGLVCIGTLGLFFWERGGKKFVLKHKIYFLNSLIPKTWQDIVGFFWACSQRKEVDKKDFLDCLACLGEDKVKELIKELEAKE